MKKIPAILLILLLSVAFTGCDILDQDSYQEYIVIESYAYAGSPYPEIKITKTLQADVVYDETEAAIKVASVQLSRLDENGEAAETAEYLPSETTPGLFIPAANHFLIRENTTYRFEIEIPGEEPIRAETQVPRQFQIINRVPDEIIYQSENQLEIVISNTSSKGSFDHFYLFSSTALEPSMNNLTPFYLAAVENDDEQDYTDYIITNSGIISENNFVANDDGTITLTYPWIGVSFYGHNQMITYSVDKNTYDLVRSQSVQLGGSNLSPGEIPNLIYNIEGAIGIFGSMSADTVYTNFTRP